ncbi:HTH-type transcriptional repressor KstR2 domain protein [Mycobacterium kansasii]|uniref:HTH-type transcriptional repressor KstR2 domain protein n=1 Tax=Mycobacterium kansasii TaxID=1768 RepID=A0A1V3W8J7_MYCKA|nr:HTH-type transcriptional repressor KstR2 domain protein [Mycobacterium kansasii]
MRSQRRPPPPGLARRCGGLSRAALRNPAYGAAAAVIAARPDPARPAPPGRGHRRKRLAADSNSPPNRPRPPRPKASRRPGTAEHPQRIDLRRQHREIRHLTSMDRHQASATPGNARTLRRRHASPAGFARTARTGMRECEKKPFRSNTQRGPRWPSKRLVDSLVGWTEWPVRLLAARRVAGACRGNVRRARPARHHRARHRRRCRHSLRQPVSPFLLQGGDGRRAAARVPRLAVQSLPRNRGHRAQSAGTAQGLFMASFEAIEHRHAQVVIYQDEAQRLSSQPRFSYLEDRNKQQRKMWVEVLKQGIAEATSGPTRCRLGLPLHPGHHLGVGALVSAGGPLTASRWV